MKDRAGRFREVSEARDTLELAPRLTTGVAIGPNVAAPAPAVIGAIRIGTKMRVRVDGAPASAGEGDDGWWGPRCLGAGGGILLTGLAQRFVDQSGEGFGRFGAPASDRKSTRLNSSHVEISYAVFCLKK